MFYTVIPTKVTEKSFSLGEMPNLALTDQKYYSKKWISRDMILGFLKGISPRTVSYLLIIIFNLLFMIKCLNLIIKIALINIRKGGAKSSHFTSDWVSGHINK